MRLRKFITDISGVAAVEFALIAPVLILMLVGIADYGLYLNAVMKLENAARASGQYVIQGGDPANIEDDILLESNLGLTEAEIASLDITSDYVCACHDGEVVECVGGTCPDAGDYVHRYFEMTINRDYEPMLPYPGVPDPVTLSASVVLRVD